MRDIATIPALSRAPMPIPMRLRGLWAKSSDRLVSRSMLFNFVKHIGLMATASASILLAGRIGNDPLTLYQIYAEGNFIECQPDAPFLQIGELKYGKPILDRALTWASPLDEAVKVALISFDATIRSNLSVGRPLDLIVIPMDRTKPIIRRRIEADDAYFNELSATWGRMLNEARTQIPDPPFM